MISKWDEIITDLEYNPIKIYNRRLMLKSIDLVYHSVGSFNFDGDLVTRGFGDALLIGATRCGKSKSAERYMMHCGTGEMIKGENVSYPGLVGGVRMTDKSQIIIWGKFVKNDRQLLTCDEFSNLDQETISRLSDLRSSGVAEVVKIKSSKAWARTRKIFISNPRDGSDLGDYEFPINTVRQLIGRKEDIARFDIIQGILHTDISSREIAEARKKHVPHIFTSRLCHERVVWAWTRTPDQIIFTPKAINEIYTIAEKQVKDWSSDIPIVIGPEQHEKVARLTAALAARLYSTDDSGAKLIITKVHAKAIEEYMHQLFTDDGLKYDRYVERFRRRNKVFTDNTASIADLVKEHIPFYQEVIRVFIDNKYVQPQQLEQEIYQMSPIDVKKAVGLLSQWGLILRNRHHGYRKTGNFNKLLGKFFTNELTTFNTEVAEYKEADNI